MASWIAGHSPGQIVNRLPTVLSADYLALFVLNHDRTRSIPSSVLTELE
jgi:hypothetical protein